jgi:hypothetical protein
MGVISMRQFDEIEKEAEEHCIEIKKATPRHYSFRNRETDEIMAWMDYFPHKKLWVGFTKDGDKTGRHEGRRSLVADWCLGWSIDPWERKLTV